MNSTVLLLTLSFSLLLLSCASSSKESESADDLSRYTVYGTYGYTAEDPIRCGGDEGIRSGPARERDYLNRLRGPNGEDVGFMRQGSCCHFETPNGILGTGLLDMYEVWYDGIDEPVILYLNMYDPHEGEVVAPQGFLLAEE